MSWPGRNCAIQALGGGGVVLRMLPGAGRPGEVDAGADRAGKVVEVARGGCVAVEIVRVDDLHVGVALGVVKMVTLWCVLGSTAAPSLWEAWSWRPR